MLHEQPAVLQLQVHSQLSPASSSQSGMVVDDWPPQQLVPQASLS